MREKLGLVVSVGGSKGAYAGGIVDYYLRSGKKYDVLVGSSTGSLVVPLAASSNARSMKLAYTNITNKDVFTRDPIKVKQQKNGMFRYSINYWNVFKNVILHGQATLGDSTKLKETIFKFFPQEDYLKILEDGTSLSIMVTNLTTQSLEQKYLIDCTYEEFCEWMWTSACAPPFMSISKMNNFEYVDGGILSQVPIKQAILAGCDEIDIIVLDKEEIDVIVEKVKNLFHYHIKVLLTMMNKIKEYQLDLGYLTQHATKTVKLNFHYTERRLTNNSLIFVPELTSKWWEEGFNYAKEGKCVSYLINGKTKKFKKI